MLAHHYAVLTKYYLAEFQSKSDQWFKPSRKNWFLLIQIFPETLNLVQCFSKRSDRNDLLLLKSWTFPWELENEVHKSLRRSIWVEQLIHVSCCPASCSDVWSGNEKFNLNLNLTGCQLWWFKWNLSLGFEQTGQLQWCLKLPKTDGSLQIITLLSK